jgi:DNA-binding NtrC family response regulator
VSKSILFIDDDLQIQETARDILEDAGFHVETAGTCREALKCLKANPVPVAIIDLNLPDGLGTEFAIEAKKLHPALVVILMTGEANVDLGPAQTAIMTTLTKPVSPLQLLKLLNTLF